MQLQYILLLGVAFIAVAYAATEQLQLEDDESEVPLVRRKRGLLLAKKALLLGGAALIGKKALLLGGAALGGAALLKAKSKL